MSTHDAALVAPALILIAAPAFAAPAVAAGRRPATVRRGRERRPAARLLQWQLRAAHQRNLHFGPLGALCGASVAICTCG